MSKKKKSNLKSFEWPIIATMGTILLCLVFAYPTYILITEKIEKTAKCKRLKRAVRADPALIKVTSSYDDKYCLGIMLKIKTWIKVGKKYLRQKQVALAEEAFSRAKIIAAKANINIAHLLLIK